MTMPSWLPAAVRSISRFSTKICAASRLYPVAAVLLARAIPFAFVTGYGSNGVDATHLEAKVPAETFSGARYRCGPSPPAIAPGSHHRSQ